MGDCTYHQIEVQLQKEPHSDHWSSQNHIKHVGKQLTSGRNQTIKTSSAWSQPSPYWFDVGSLLGVSWTHMYSRRVQLIMFASMRLLWRTEFSIGDVVTIYIPKYALGVRVFQVVEQHVRRTLAVHVKFIFSRTIRTGIMGSLDSTLRATMRALDLYNAHTHCTICLYKAWNVTFDSAGMASCPLRRGHTSKCLHIGTWSNKPNGQEAMSTDSCGTSRGDPENHCTGSSIHHASQSKVSMDVYLIVPIKKVCWFTSSSILSSRSSIR